MPKVTLSRSQMLGGRLPPVCIVCGEAARHLRYPHVQAPGFAFDGATAFLSYFWFWISILLASRASNVSAAGLPFCDEHEHYWSRRGWLILGCPALIAAAMIAGASGVLKGPMSLPGPDLGFFGVVAALLVMLYLMLASVRPTGGDVRTVVLSGAHRNFVAAIEREERGYDR